MPKMWMVRAARDGVLAEEFTQRNVVAVNWLDTTDLSSVTDATALRAMIDAAYSDSRPGQRVAAASQLARFLWSFNIGDEVTTYNPALREYIVGRIAGGYEYWTDALVAPDGSYPHVRQVEWRGRVSRDALSTSSRNSLGSIATIFGVAEAAAEEIELLLQGTVPNGEAEAGDDQPLQGELETLREETVQKAHEFIKDRVIALDWEQMQLLVAGVLRAIGYKTRVSPRGSDQGRDIIASPDGLGMESPRIVVEVKHRPKEQMGAPTVRSFLGGLRSGDRGLYVSTGGFSREAKYEADRATVPVTLLDLDDLVRLLVENYESADMDTRALVPLLRLYWPATGS
jgi:restriction system protein